MARKSTKKHRAYLGGMVGGSDAAAVCKCGCGRGYYVKGGMIVAEVFRNGADVTTADVIEFVTHRKIIEPPLTA